VTEASATAGLGDGLATYDSLRSASPAAALLSEQPLPAVPSAAPAAAACIDGESNPELGDVNVPVERSLVRMLRSVGDRTASGGVELCDAWRVPAGVVVT